MVNIAQFFSIYIEDFFFVDRNVLVYLDSDYRVTKHIIFTHCTKIRYVEYLFRGKYAGNE